MTTRRDALIALPLLCMAMRVQAQAPKGGRARRIGLLGPDNPTYVAYFERPILTALRKVGWTEGANLMVARAYADGAALAGRAEDLVRQRVDVVVCMGQASVAAARATRTVPIVFGDVLWPIEAGLIDSFARPGRNATGVASYAGIEITTKRLEYLRQIAREAKRLAWVWPASLYSLETVAGGTVDMRPMVESAAKGLGFEIRFHTVGQAQSIDALFEEIMTGRAQALSAGGGRVYEAGQRIAELALEHRLASAFISRPSVEAGGLLSYSPAASEDALTVHRMADYVDRILRGAKPADLPVELPSRYELVLNLRTAKLLGLTVPPSLLTRADAIIQ